MLRFTVSLLIASAGMLALVGIGADTALAQKGNDPPPVSISFRNDTKLTLVVRGSSNVKGMVRGGQPILIREGKKGFDNNVPPGNRLITIVDYNNPTRPLWFNFPIVVPPGRDMQLVIRSAPNEPNRISLAPDQQ